MTKGKERFQWDGKTIQLLELIMDLLIIMTMYTLSIEMISSYSLEFLLNGGNITRDYLLTVTLLLIGSFIFFRVYRISITNRGYLSVMFRVSVSLGVVGLILLLLAFIHVDYTMPKTALGLMLVFQLSIFMAVKGILYIILRRINMKTSIIIGPKDEVEILAKKILYDDNKFVVLKYLAYDDFENDNINILYKYIDDVDYVYLTENFPAEKKNVIISYCFKIKKSFYLVPKLYELSLNKAHVSQVGDALIYSIKGLGLTLEERLIKRVFDILLSVVMLIIMSPIILMIAITIKLYDKGPILFRQERITRNNKSFLLYKFRTMIPDAEKETGPVQASVNDSRITPIGKILRKTRLDEIPQLFNVIKGEMSIVGPRALRVEEVQEFVKYDSKFMYRSNVKAGITGYAQTMGNYSTIYSDKLKFDIFYITNYSVFNDLIILLHTVKSIFDPKSSEGINNRISFSDSIDRKNMSIVNSEDKSIKIITSK